MPTTAKLKNNFFLHFYIEVMEDNIKRLMKTPMMVLMNLAMMTFLLRTLLWMQGYFPLTNDVMLMISKNMMMRRIKK